MFLLLILVILPAKAMAETTWFDRALEFLGLTSEPIAADSPPAPPPTAALPALTEQVLEAARPMASDVLGLSTAITDQLGVSKTQADGGLGVLFSLAQSTLSGGDFGKLSDMVPGMDALIAAAPAVAPQVAGLTSMLGDAGKYAGALQGATQAYSQFKTLGLGVEQIPQYIQVTDEFLRASAGEDAVSLFNKGVASLLGDEK